MDNKLLISVIKRERNHCDDDNHLNLTNQSQLIDETDETENQKRIKIDELKKLNLNDLLVIEFGGLKLTNEIIELVFKNQSKLQCFKCYDCQGISNDELKFIGE